MSRSSTIVVCAVCVLGLLVAGCARKGPLSIRFTRHVDDVRLEQLPRRSGSVVLLADAAFWTDQEKVGRIPVARREKSFFIGPGATEMASKMLQRIFDRVIDVRSLDHVEDPECFDFVIRLLHESFDDGTLFLPLFSRHRYRLDLGALVTHVDGSFIALVEARGSESFWSMNLAAANPLSESDSGFLGKASRTLNAAVQESLFGLMDELESLPAFVGVPPREAGACQPGGTVQPAEATTPSGEPSSSLDP